MQNFLKSGNFLKTGISELNWILHTHFYWVSHSWDWMHSTLRPMVNECSLTYDQQIWKDSVFCFWCRSLLVMCKISFSIGGHLWIFSILFLPKNTHKRNITQKFEYMHPPAQVEQSFEHAKHEIIEYGKWFILCGYMQQCSIQAYISQKNKIQNQQKWRVYDSCEPTLPSPFEFQVSLANIIESWMIYFIYTTYIYR